jgi:hypothetical protein
VVICPDGTRYEGDANSLSACPGGADLVPSAATSAIGSTVSLSFRGTAGGPLHVFTCR